VLVVVWQVIAAALFPPVLFPTPVMVAKAFVTEIASGRLLGDSLVSLRRIFAGFVLGCTIGAGLGLLMGVVPFARRFLDPYIPFGTLGYLADKTFQALIHRLAWRYAPTN